MRLSGLISKIERRIPLGWAEEWDNPGLAVGDPEAEIVRIALALDASEKTVCEAARTGCQLLFTHHPAIFSAMKSIVFKTPGPKTLGLAIQKGVALYSAHTNWDSSSEGVNFCLAEALNLSDIEPLIKPPGSDGAWGLGAYGNLANAMSISECMLLVKDMWRLSSCAAFCRGSEQIKRIAVGGGSCGDFWPQALEAGADIFITADVPYHHRIDALAMGMPLITCDHGEMERVSLGALKALIENETGLEVVLLKEEPEKRLVL